MWVDDKSRELESDLVRNDGGGVQNEIKLAGLLLPARQFLQHSLRIADRCGRGGSDGEQGTSSRSRLSAATEG